ncbi:MAG: glycosyltransferase [Xanthomonadaceae bacterium]|nr:glycosyltransferase [Xanthomonadaceae bacterium]
MKILYIITGLGLGGAEKVVADLADQMVLRGHTVKIAFLTGEISVRPKSDKVEIIPLKLNGAKDFFSASKRYRMLIKEYQPNVVHAHMVHANIFARLNRLFCKIPKLICTAHNSNEGGKIRMLAYKLTNFLSDFNSNVSKEASISLIKKGAFTQKNLHTIYNGINLTKFTKKPSNSLFSTNDCINFLSVGRFNDQKDYPNLLNAIHTVTATHNNLHFYIAGDGELRSEIEGLIKRLNIEKFVTLLGRRNDIPLLMSQADFFVLSSKHEGLPTVLLEAMACEAFVIATDCGGSKEIMGNTGLLVPKQNSQALANAIIKSISLSSQQIKDNNSFAKNRIEDVFSLEVSVKNWLKIYES